MSDAFRNAEKLFRSGDFQRCFQHCRLFLVDRPADRAAHHLAAVALIRAGQARTGAVMLERALTAAPDDLMLRMDRALALSEAGDVDGAVTLLAAGARFHPGNPDLAARLARLLSQHGRHGEAQSVLVAALRLCPDHLELRGLFAAELAADLQFEQALWQMRLMQAMLPEQGPLYANEGVLLQSQGRVDDAIGAYRRAITIDPDNAVAQVNLGTALLTVGDYARGFRHYEHRLALPDVRHPPAPLPWWRGEAISGKTLLVSAEQGFGDVLQFVRFLPLLRSRCAAVWLECPVELHRLLRGLPDLAGVLGPGDCLPEIDLAAPLLSLPHLLGSAGNLMAETIPYLPLPPLAAELPEETRPRIGLVWRGRPTKGELFIRRSLARRSCRLDELRPLWSDARFAWFSLQLGEEGEIAGTGIQDLAPLIGDFADSARLMAGLDLIISIDSAAAHLAAGLGRPLWVMLAPGQCDYRWNGTAGPSPWYPAARLFRAGRGGFAALAIEMASRLHEV